MRTIAITFPLALLFAGCASAPEPGNDTATPQARPPQPEPAATAIAGDGPTQPTATELAQADFGPAPVSYDAQILRALAHVTPDVAGYEMCPPERSWFQQDVDRSRVFCWRIDVSVRSKDGSKSSHSFWFKHDQPLMARLGGMPPIYIVDSPARPPR